MQSTPSPELAITTRAAMIAEGKRIIDAATERGVVLRLFGGLAVRAHCEVISFCERDYADLDMIGLASQFGQIPGLMRELGYRENVLVGQATENRQLQFYRRCEHNDARTHYFAHPDDHVDIFLDTFRMDHEIPLRDRLTLERYTISVTDALLTKLQIHRLDEKDVRDILTLLKDIAVGDDDRDGMINANYIAERCARDWGLYHDVTTNLEACRAVIGDCGLSSPDLERIEEHEGRLLSALQAAPKSLAWRLRGKVGTRRPWYNTLEDQD